MPAITTAFAQGTHAARSAAASANQGYYYYETDTGALFQSTGASWVQVAATSSWAANQTANAVLSGPTSGGAAAPAFRALVAADIPSLDTSKLTTGTIASARLGNVTQVLPWTTAAQTGGPVPSTSAINKVFMATTGGTVYTDITATFTGSGATLNYGAVNDALYIGSTATAGGQFLRIALARTTAAVWTATVQWEYFNGSTWTTIPANNFLTDGPAGWTVSANVTLFPPTDWATTTVNGTSAYWMRSRMTAFTSTTTSPIYRNGALIRLQDFTTSTILIPASGNITKVVALSTSTDYGLYATPSGSYGAIQTGGAGGTATPSIAVTAGDSIVVFSVTSAGVVAVPTTIYGYLTCA